MLKNKAAIRTGFDVSAGGVDQFALGVSQFFRPLQNEISNGASGQ
jgi:hypothetical protein